MELKLNDAIKSTQCKKKYKKGIYKEHIETNVHSVIRQEKNVEIWTLS